MDAWDELPEEKKGKGPPKVAKVSITRFEKLELFYTLERAEDCVTPLLVLGNMYSIMLIYSFLTQGFLCVFVR